MICANLFIFDADDVLLKIVQGTSSFTLGGVVKVAQRGRGCYTITLEKNRDDPVQTADDLCWDPTMTPSNYKEEDDPKTMEMERTWKIK